MVIVVLLHDTSSKNLSHLTKVIVVLLHETRGNVTGNKLYMV